MSDAYHHGDLRRALLDDAAEVLTTEGIGALSLRDLARRTGVSATAPYHHFRGKADLVTALCDDALADLDRALAEVGPGSPEERLQAQGVAYVLFAVEHPERFRLAFRPELGSPFATLAHGDTLPEDAVAFRHLLAVVRELVADPAEQLPAALAAWSLVHGLAALLIDGPLQPMANDHQRVRALAEAVTDRLAL